MTSRLPARTGRLTAVAATLLGATLGLVGLTPGSAHADSRTVRDATGDVYKLTGVQNGKKPVRVPKEKVADITSVKTKHAGSAITVTLKVRALSKDAGMVVVQLRTNAGGPAYFVSGGHVAGMSFAELGRGSEVETVECAGLSLKVRPGKKTVTVRIPRACVGQPRWVRTGALYGTINTSNFSLGVADFAGKKGLPRGGAATASFPLGPKVRHN